MTPLLDITAFFVRIRLHYFRLLCHSALKPFHPPHTTQNRVSNDRKTAANISKTRTKTKRTIAKHQDALTKPRTGLESQSEDVRYERILLLSHWRCRLPHMIEMRRRARSMRGGLLSEPATMPSRLFFWKVNRTQHLELSSTVLVLEDCRGFPTNMNPWPSPP